MRIFILATAPDNDVVGVDCCSNFVCHPTPASTLGEMFDDVLMLILSSEAINY